jgi:Peptidase A4 family
VLCGASALSVSAARPALQPGLRLGALRPLGPDRAAANGETQTSTNWAGYAVRYRRAFASATGRWVQPAAACEAGTQTYSAFWVGLGGFSRTSHAVEQTGTQANCHDGVQFYGAWYELYPAPPVELKLKIRPGDTMSATVTVNKKTVVIRLKNVTTGKTFAKRLRMARPDQSSAEWVAEAPTGCDYVGNCSTLPLTNFGTVAFSHGTATVKGHRGRISDPVWVATTIELRGDVQEPNHPSAAGANAIPGALGADGGSFSITWQGLTPAPGG